MSVKYITDLEIVNNEENIAGDESMLMVQGGEAKLVPMNFIKGSGSEMLVVDIGNLDALSPEDVTVGDAVKEAVQNGQPICLYINDQYFYPVYCKIATTTSGTTVNVGIYGTLYGTTPSLYNLPFNATYVG